MSPRSQSGSGKVTFQGPFTVIPSLTSMLPEQIQYFQGKCWGSESACFFYDSPHSPSYFKTGSGRPAPATAGSFYRRSTRVPRNHSFSLLYRETMERLPLSLPDCLDKYLTDNLFSFSSFLLVHPHPHPSSSAISKELILDKGKAA